MTATDESVYEKLCEEAMKLPDDARSKLAWVLLDSVPNDVDDGIDDRGAVAAWDAEIDKRIAEIDSGKVVGMDPYKAIDDIKAKFK